MTIEITRPGKNSLEVQTPVMPAAGTFGYGEVYREIYQCRKTWARL
ncbi:hypothetical protein HC928_25565 [bacterium]|nr:hypothetical protein [bacterium]